MQAHRAGGRARLPRGAGVPAARLAARRVPGRLRASRLPRAGRVHPRALPGRDVPALQYRVRAGVLGGDGRMCLPGARGRVRVPGRRAAARRVRQRHRGRAPRRRADRHLRAVPPLRRALRSGLQLHQPPLRQREGLGGEQGRGASAQPVRADTAVLRREGLQQKAPRGVPEGVRRQAPLPKGRDRARALRGRPRGALAPARIALRVRHVAHQEVRQAGRLQGRREPPLLRRPGDGLPRGRRRHGRLRRHGRRARRRGRRRVPARVGRRADGLRGPRAPAEAALRTSRWVARQRGEEVAARGARGVPRLGGAGGPRRGPQGAARRERPPRLGRGGGGRDALARGDRRRGRRHARAVGRQGGGGRRAGRVRRAGGPRGVRPGLRAAGGRCRECLG